MQTKTHTNESAKTKLNFDLTAIPPLLDVPGVRRYLAPISRSTLYSLTASKEIESASVGMGRGRRMFVAASVAAWLQRRAAVTLIPRIAPRKLTPKVTASVSPAQPASPAQK